MSRYICTDDLDVGTWKILFDLGLVGKRLYIKGSHPHELAVERKLTLRELITTHIVEQVNDDKKFYTDAIAAMYCVSEDLVRRAVGDARKRLCLGNGYRYTARVGGFLHYKETKKYKRKMSKPGSRPKEAVVADKRGLKSFDDNTSWRETRVKQKDIGGLPFADEDE